MAAVFAVLLLGLLAPAAAAAAPPPPSCDDVITPLRRDQVDKASGSWVMLGSVTDAKTSMLSLLSSSAMELPLLEDNSSFIYTEREGYVNGSCVWYHIAGDITDDANLTVKLHTEVRDQDGVVTTTRGYFGQITLFQSCPSCPEDRLTVYYSDIFDPADSKSTNDRYIMNYRRAGTHQDLEALKEVPLSTRQQAVCLNMTETTGEFSYDGVIEPCPRKVLVLKPSCDDVITPLRRDQVDKALGSWVLVGSVTDEKTALLPQISSSFMELSLTEDNSSFIYTERNGFVNGSCAWYHIVGDITDDANLTVRIHSMVREQDGVETTTRGYFGQITLFQSCPSCPEDRLTSYYSGIFDPSDSKSPNVRFIMNYRRAGTHQDLEALKEVPLSTRQQAVCLNMTETTGEYSYDGVSEPCPRKVLVLKPEEETEH